MSPDDVARLLAGQPNMLTTPPPNFMPNTQFAMSDDPFGLKQMGQRNAVTGFGGGGYSRMYRGPSASAPANMNVESKQIETDPYTQALIDKQWNAMVKKGNTPDLNLVK